MQKLISFFIAFIICFSSLAEQAYVRPQQTDSLKEVINNAKNDSIKVNALLRLDELIFLSNPKLSFNLNNRIILLCKDNLRKNISADEKLFYKIKLSSSFNNLGVFYTDLANYEQALFYYEKAIDINKKLQNNLGLANDYNNVAWICVNQSSFNKAREYYNNALFIFKEFNDIKSIALVLKNIGNIYIENGEYEKAMQYCQESLNLSIENGLPPYVLEDIGRMYFETNDYDKALENYNSIANYYKISGSIRDLSFIYQSVANLYRKKGNNKRAVEYFKKSINLKESVNSFDGLDKCALNLYEIYKEEGNDNKSLKYHELYMVIKDTLNVMSANESVFRFEIEQEYELKKQSDSLIFENQLIVAKNKAKAKTEKSKIVRNYLVGILLLILSLLLFLFFHYKKTKSQKFVIENQHKDLTSSITYAKTIQAALFPTDKAVKELLLESFILYLPKDIVAGDFYWLEKQRDTLFFAVADCTGHGVPGAMVSVICNNGLNRSVREHKINEPGEILDKTREIILKEFEKSENEVSDGMDIALCSLSGSKLKYAGAHNPLWIIRENELIEIKANHQPIGKYRNSQPFTTHTIDLFKGDCVYLFTDGFADQFGGEKGKKYKKANLKKLLLSINGEPMQKQRDVLQYTFENWTGNLEQIDDVCVMGVRV